MGKRSSWMIFGAGLVLASFVLSACAPAQQAPLEGANQVPVAGQGTPGAGRNGFGGAGITADMPLEAKLAVGLLKLEGTNLSVTPAEAKQMLPLWEKVKSEEAAFITRGTPQAGAASTPPAAQLQTVYQEIEKSLSPAQLKALQDMAISGSELRNLMVVLEITPAAGNFGPGGANAEQRATFAAEGTQVPNGFGGLSANDRATRIAEGTQLPNGFGGNGTRTPRNGTPGAGGAFRGGFGFNNLFLDPLIKMLQDRAGS